MTLENTTATCFCGAVQNTFSLEPPHLLATFICNCTDCRKLTASTFATNFIISDKNLRVNRGADKVSTFTMQRTIASGNSMTNYFCSVCGSLMYRVSSGLPGYPIMRVGQVDDLSLHDTVLAPQVEQYTHDRVAWLKDVEGAKQLEGAFPFRRAVREAEAAGKKLGKI